MTSTDSWTHSNLFILARVYLILFSSRADPLATIEKLYGLLRVLVVGVLKAFFSTDTANNTRLARTPAFVDASFSIVPLRQLPIAVRMLRFVFVEHPLFLHHAHALLLIADLAMLLSEGRHFIGVYSLFLLGLLVTDDRLCGLLFVLATVLAI